MPRPLLLLTSALASALALAQPPPPPAHAALHSDNAGAQAAQYTAPDTDQSGCPVGFSVERRSATEILKADDPAASPGAQGIHLFLQAAKGRDIESADILVHGINPRPAFTPAETSLMTDERPGNSRDSEDRRSPESKRDITRQFHLRRDRNSNGLRQSDITVDHISVVRSVDLLAVRFTDGTAWSAATSNTCRAVPSLFLAVDAPVR